MKVFNILLLLLLSSMVGKGQQLVSEHSMNEQAKLYLSHYTKQFTPDANYEIFKMDYKLLLEHQFTLSFDNQISSHKFKRQHKIDRKNGLISWFGQSNNSSMHSQFVINPALNTIHGLFYIGNQQYHMIPLGQGYHFVIAEKDYKNQRCGNKDPFNHIESEEQVQENISNYARAIHCAQRVLIAYTPKAKLTKPDMKGYVQMEIDQTNLAYLNGGVNNLLEVAIIYETNYSESYTEEICWNDGLAYTMTTDLCRFQDEDDGQMDEVHNLRTLYHADICILFVDDLVDNVGGQAYDVGAGADDEAFCVVDITNFNYRVAHEVGHLQGCHHDRYVLEGILTDYHYGFVNLQAATPFRTIMAYDDECEDNQVDCARQPIFSTPNFTWMGDSAGDEHNPPFDSGHNNSQQIMDTKNFVENFRTISTYLDVYTLFEFSDQEYVYATALNNIENKFFGQAFPYKVGNGAVVHWRTEQNMNLLPGFHAKSGSSFEAKISTTCEQPPY